MDDMGWTVLENKFDAACLHHKETVFAVGNGYLTIRGTFEEGYPGAWPATLIHGVYDDVPIFHTELANCPDPIALVVLVDGERFRLDR
jgi:kojibiose phosphorylase